MAFLASLATAVAPSLVSGLFGRKKNKAQGVDYQKLVNDATAAGFNPLTALRNGGSQAYTREPVLSSTSFIGEALGKGLQTAFNHKEQEAEAKKEKLEIEIMEAQLESIQNSNKSVGGEYFGFNIPSASQTTGINHGNVKASRNSSSVSRAGPTDTTDPNLEYPEREKYNLYVDVYDSQTGRWMTIPNPDLMDMSPQEIIASGAVLGLADAGQNGLGLGGVGGKGKTKKPKPPATAPTLTFPKLYDGYGRGNGPRPQRTSIKPKLTQRRVYPSMRFPNTHYSRGPS